MDKFIETIENSEKILLTSHIYPDGDAVSSLVSMYDFLAKTYPDKEYGLFITSEIEFKGYQFLKHGEKIKWVKDISEVVNNYQTLIFLDGNLVSRFSNESEKIDLTKFQTICIDHHAGSADNFTLNLSDINQASCAQLVYKLFFQNNKDKLDKEIAEAMMIGIITDTGTLKYINAQKTDTLTIAKELIEFGDFDLQILELKVSQFEDREFEILKMLIANTTNIEPENNPPLTYSFLPAEILNNYKIEEIKRANDKYKMIILRQVKNHNWGFVITPDSEKELSVSFRSTKGAPNVQLLAQNFNGGGHVMAAGGKIVLSPEVKNSEDACKIILEYIKNNSLVLT